jgi:hypothetical protein
MEELPGQSICFPGNITLVIHAHPATVAVKQENPLPDVNGPGVRDIFYHVI